MQRFLIKSLNAMHDQTAAKPGKNSDFLRTATTKIEMHVYATECPAFEALF